MFGIVASPDIHFHMMTRPDDVIDRDREWARLGALLSDGKPHLSFVTGRRRVGKSYLLARFTRECNGIYYQATRQTEADQLAQLSREIGERFDSAMKYGAAFPSWEDLLRYLLERAEREPVVVVLDEFPYLSSAAPAVTSIIQKVWDHQWQDRPLKLILSGSYITVMRQLEEADQPLFGRRTAKIVFAPFAAWDVKHFAPGYSVRDQLIAYGIFGNLPGNLALLDPDRSPAGNAAALLLEPTGRLVDEAKHMLDTFLGEADVHYSVLNAIAQGEHTWSGITKRIGKGSASVSRPLQWLEEMDVIMRVVPVTEADPARSKRTLYRLADPYASFWYRFVAPLGRSGSIGIVEADSLWSEKIEPHLNDYMGPIFEQICRDYVRRPGVLPFQPYRVGEWWDSTSENQVDVVALGGSGELLVGEAKWGGVTREDLSRLRRRGLMLAVEIGDVSRIYHVLFSAGGSVDADVSREAQDGHVIVITGSDIVA